MKSWKRKLRMGMVGGGQDAFIGGVHRMAAALDQQIELVAGCFSRDVDNTSLTGNQLYLDPARCYASYADMAKGEAALPVDKRIDFVSIVTPNHSHFSIAEAFLNAGFHVICDKPLAFSLAEAEKLAETVSNSQLVFVLTHNYTGHPLIRHARHLFLSGQMGRVRKVMVEYLQDFLMYPHEKEGLKQAVWRVDPTQAGVGGAIADAGTHAFNLLEYVTGDRVVQLCADNSTFLPDRTLPEDSNTLVRLRGGGKGVLAISQIATGEENGLRLRVYAEKGAIVWSQETPNFLELYRYGQPRETLTRANAGYLSESANQCTRVPPGHPEGYLEAFATIYCDAVEAIRAYINGTALKVSEYKFPTIVDGVRGMKYIEKTIESSNSGGCWVDL